MTKTKRLISAVLLCVICVSLFGCAETDAAKKADDVAIATFRDIPGITAEEISQIEAILSRRQGFTFGSMTSIEAYINEEGEIVGFVPKLSALLSDLFGVEFTTQIYNWQDMHANMMEHKVDFTTSLNMPADMECHYIHSSPIAGYKLSAFTDVNGPEVMSEYDIRGRNVGFYHGSHTEEIVRREFPRVEFTTVAISSADDMAQKLSSGEIDVFITDTADVFEFYQFEHVHKSGDFPYVYVPATVSTANDELSPIISAITKYLAAGGIKEINRLYEASEQSYAAHAIWQTLNDEERAYIENKRESGEQIPYGATAARYPVAFYNYDIGDFDGIALDVLREISTLTGLEFYPKCDENTTWGELEGMLREGEIALLSQLIPNEARSEYAIWPDPYFTARYALLSNVDTPFLSIDQVPYQIVGMSGGTAEEARYRAWFPEDTSYVTFTFSDEGLDALEKGEIDLFFSLDYTMLYESNYRENPHQKINILFDTPVEPVPFGLNINEEILCSIIEKSQKIINTDRIVRSWTSRIVDKSAIEEAERTRVYMTFTITLLILFAILFLFFARSQKLKKNFENQAEATLEANKNIKLLIDFAPVGIIITRRGDGEILYGNRSALNMFGYESFEIDIKGHNSTDYMPEYQSDGTLSADVVKNFWTHTDGVTEAEFAKKNGKIFTARIAYRVINYYGTVASLNIVEDMTSEKERQQMLENIAQQEKEASQLKSKFLATMSHEIRTPMNAIIGMAELALREQDKNAILDRVVTIKQAGDNLLSILTDILDLSKIEAGKVEVTEADYCVASMLYDLVSIIQTRVNESNISFTVKADSNIPKTLYGDETRVRQAILNLLSNAVKYTESGYVSFGAYCEFTGDDTVNMIYEVTDTGIGIRQEDIGRLFDDFVQLEQGGGSAEGIGLGLSITKNFVSHMGGEITVKSEYGKGSTFTITLPQKFKSREKLASVKDAKSKSVIVYQRNEAYTNSIIYTLSNLGLSYTLCKSGTELFRNMESKSFDFLFISNDLYSRNEETIDKFGQDTTVAILTELGDSSPGSRNNFIKNMSVLTMPVYCTGIADVLNGVYENITYTSDNTDLVSFSAPGARVLIVDDIITNLMVAEGLLKAYGMQVELAESGAQAIDIMKNAADGDTSKFFDIVFMDQKMPGMDGVETVKRIRAMGGIFKEVPIIALTANAVSGVVDMFMENGFNDFISKPIDTVKLNTVLEKWIPDEKKSHPPS